MSGGIYLIQDDERLVEMKERAYDSEDLLQELLARYPNLLAGDQMVASSPRRWLLVSREMGLPSEVEGGDRWSVDHLFLDQDGIPTLVEIKRSSDTRLRREVVGQMLDYAANAIVYWPVERVRSLFEAGRADADAAISSDLGIEDIEAFWARVRTNLQAGKIRMVFVSDVIPPELQRIVEFLNAQMDPAQVVALEIKQYVGQGLRSLVPRVVGKTLKPGGSTTPAPARQWDESSFFAALPADDGSADAAVVRTILDWARANGLAIRWGTGKQKGTFYPIVDHNGARHHFLAVSTIADVAIKFDYLRGGPPFDDADKRREVVRRLNAIEGIALPEGNIDRSPTLKMTALRDAGTLRQFLDVMDWIVAEIRAS